MDLPAHLAHNLRWLRERRGLTQARLATSAGVPRSTLAHLETGAGNPTLAVLSALANALGVSIEELLSAPRAGVRVHPAATLRVRRRGRSTVHELLPDPLPGMAIERMEIAPGDAFKGVPHRPGTREYLFCERGRIVLHAAGERLEVGAGDVASFQGDQPHSYANPDDVVAVGFSVVLLAG